MFSLTETNFARKIQKNIKFLMIFNKTAFFSCKFKAFITKSTKSEENLLNLVKIDHF
jgi:hypothetical protein